MEVVHRLVVDVVLFQQFGKIYVQYRLQVFHRFGASDNLPVTVYLFFENSTRSAVLAVNTTERILVGVNKKLHLDVARVVGVLAKAKFEITVEATALTCDDTLALDCRTEGENLFFFGLRIVCYYFR